MSDLYIDLGPNTPESLSVYTKAEADAKYLLNTTDNLIGTLGVGIARTEGTLHVHTASAGSVTADIGADELVLENSGNCGMTLLSPDASISNIYFGSPSDSVGAIIRWSHDADLFFIGSAKTGADLQLKSGNGIVGIHINSAQRIGMGTTSIDTCAKLEVDSTTQGILFPRMTTGQRDAIGTPVAGLVIYNTSTNKLNVYTTAWEAITSA